MATVVPLLLAVHLGLRAASHEDWKIHMRPSLQAGYRQKIPRQAAEPVWPMDAAGPLDPTPGSLPPMASKCRSAAGASNCQVAAVKPASGNHTQKRFAATCKGPTHLRHRRSHNDGCCDHRRGSDQELVGAMKIGKTLIRAAVKKLSGAEDD